MSTENASAPPITPPTNQPIGFIGTQNMRDNSQNNLPYPTSTNPPYPNSNYPPYPASNNPPYPVNNMPYPPANNQPYPPANNQYPISGSSNAPYAAYPPMNQQVHTTQPGPNTVIIQEQKLSSEPITTFCPNCKETVTTSVKYKTGTRTHAAALFLCAMDQDCCACLPYCCDKAKDAHHSCPKCGHYFGKHQPSL